MKTLLAVSAIVFALGATASANPAAAKKKSPHVLGRTAKTVLTTSPAGYLKEGAKGATYPVRHPLKFVKAVF